VVTETSSSELLQRYVNSMHEKQKLFIGDIFVFKLITFPLKQNIFSEPKVGKHGQFVVAGTEKDTSELIELLQKCAVEKFTTCRQLQARQFVSLATIVTTDYEALYAYKRIATISDVYSCLYRTYTRCCMLVSYILMLQFIKYSFSCWMMTLSH